jgi:hypothetical protein
MNAERFWLVFYMAGDLIWFSYAVRRYWRAPGDEIPQALLALLWPIWVAVHLPYRVVRWTAARRG